MNRQFVFVITFLLVSMISFTAFSRAQIAEPNVASQGNSAVPSVVSATPVPAVPSNQSGNGGPVTPTIVSPSPAVSPIIISPVPAVPNVTFSEMSGVITALDTGAQRATVTFYYPEPLIACQEDSSCSYGKKTSSTAVLNQGNVMVLNANDGVENDFTKMNVGDSVEVYFKSGGTIANAPYVVRDNSLTPSSAMYGVSSGGIVATATAQQTYTIQPVPAVTSTPDTISSAPKPVSAITITEDMGIGSDSNQVSILQSKLKSLGYFPVDTPVTGYFGSVTEKAVESFQAANKVPNTGYVGPLTKRALERR